MEKFHSGGPTGKGHTLVVNIRATGDAMQRLGLAAMATKNTVRGLNAELDELDRKRRVRYRFALLKARTLNHFENERRRIHAQHQPSRLGRALAFWRWSDRTIAIATTLLLLAMLACLGGLFYNMHL